MQILQDSQDIESVKVQVENQLKAVEKALAGSEQLKTEEEGINKDGSMITWFKGEWFWYTQVKRALEKMDESLIALIMEKPEMLEKGAQNTVTWDRSYVSLI